VAHYVDAGQQRYQRVGVGDIGVDNSVGKLRSGAVGSVEQYVDADDLVTVGSQGSVDL
jgi:hypothetical protein